MKRNLNSEECQAVKTIRESVGDASQGLPEEVFELASSIVPMINVDLLFQDRQGRILMIWREDPVCGCGWHIPGGIIRFKESIEERIQKTAQNELGVQIRFDSQLMAMNELILPQNLRGHFISLLYRCFLPEDFRFCPVADPEKAYQTGDMYWHEVCPRQWVQGQKAIYSGLFSSFRQVDIALVTEIEKVSAGACTIVFDIDGVIAQFDPTLQYDKAQPDRRMIEIVNRLYDYGNRIVLFTARGSKTGIDWSASTKAQMERWGVKYHELKFGKPAATFYIDDKNMSLDELCRLMKSLR